MQYFNVSACDINGNGKLIITDPCYKDKHNGSIELIDVAAGIWTGCIDARHGYVTCLYAWNVASSFLIANDTFYEDCDQTIYVDSGQAGIFNFGSYPFGSIGEFEDKNSFYGKICEMTTDHMWGFVDEGIVSNSGYGDGEYIVRVIVDDGKIVAVKIMFAESYEKVDEDE